MRQCGLFVPVCLKVSRMTDARDTRGRMPDTCGRMPRYVIAPPNALPAGARNALAMEPYAALKHAIALYSTKESIEHSA